MAQAHAALIAPADEQWDDILLVSYPSREAFLAMLAERNIAPPRYIARRPWPIRG